ncbi:MAG: glycosyltransferase family 2 protein [Calditrichaeota bacterium]|nr:MAG: glycosyltransferase family 2 protein [Calditrichota bacterium]MBL1204168.1 glycosyltransferase family 2 protein [Calditrichota bacterium]NOG43998.1 glycosyltransferase family 2 protein [Calditrichota bacterium]
MSLPSYSILIPAYNSQSSIGELIDQIIKIENKPDAIIVVNDGSKDNTSEIANSKNVIVYDSIKNYGKGNALKKGFEIFISKTESDYVLCMDADLQHEPASINSFLKKTTNNAKPVVVGKRDFKIGQMPFLRYLSNTFTSAILSKISGQNIEDSQCGFRLIKRDIIKQVKTKENGFQFESEFLIECAKKKIEINFVSIPTIYNNSASNISHIKDTFKFTQLILKEIFT